MNNHILIFFVASPLQIIIADAIKKEFYTHENHRKVKAFLVCYSRPLSKIPIESKWDSIVHLLPPRKYPNKGFFGVSSKILENLLLIHSMLDSKSSINIFAPSYDTETLNYFISFLRKTQNSCFFHLIPDGLLNLVINTKTPSNYFLKKLRWFRRLYDSNLQYTNYMGDRLGSEADFIKTIYTIPGILTNYSKEKTREISFLKKSPKSSKFYSDQNKVLIIGQPLLGFKLVTIEQCNAISTQIFDWLVLNNLNEVYYKKHPRDCDAILYHKCYELIKDDIIVEEYMQKNFFKYVIGVHSSVLIFAKQIYGEMSTVISFGMDRVLFKNQKLKARLTETYKNLDIVIK